VVIPSLPATASPASRRRRVGLPVSIAKAWAALMQRLTYTKYVAQGGDWGNAVSEIMALQEAAGTCSASTPTWRPRFRQRLEGARVPRGAARRSQRRKSATRGNQLVDFYGKGLRIRPRDVEPPANALLASRIRRSDSPPG